MNKIKASCTIAAYCGLTAILSGCLSTSLQSMSSRPLTTAHQPRLDPSSKDTEFTLSVNALGTFSSGDSWFNTQKAVGGGGEIGGTYRLGNVLSPLFFSGTISGFGGKVNFDCENDEKCDGQYQTWLASRDGQDDYSFWGTREVIRTGLEFHPPIYLFFGLGAGIQFYQGGGKYDRQREKLDERFVSINNIDDGIDYSYLFSTWTGFHLGKKGQYGTISLELSFSNSYINNEADVIYIPGTISYFHPSGFQGGLTLFTDKGFVFYGGKSFQF